MPSLTPNFTLRLQDDYKNYPTFIETGTLNGDTIFAMEPLFKNLYTIELSPKYYFQTLNNYTGNKIKFFHGDSSYILTELCPEIKDNAIFFLDAHWSNGDTARGDIDCPLVNEIRTINNLFQQDAIIIIDDFRLFETNVNEDWSNICKSLIENILKQRMSKSYHFASELSPNDRWVIHIKSIEKINI
jgi:hypothetical protein